MKTQIMLPSILFILILAIAGCENYEEVDLEAEAEMIEKSAQDSNNTSLGDNEITEEDKKCPQSCDDNNTCTEDSCSEDTGFECLNKAIENCCGNDVCEKGETSDSCAADCPVCAQPTEKCTVSEFNYETGKCEEADKMPCCGNSMCEIVENTDNCNEDCTGSSDLENYPSFLGSKTILAIGDDAKGNDIFAATTIGNALLVKGKTTETLTQSKISDLNANDMIVIGRPCENGIWEVFMGIDNCDDWLDANKGIIKLVEKGSQKIIFMSGDTPENTQKLAEVLADPDKYGLSGTKMEATMSGSGISLS